MRRLYSKRGAEWRPRRWWLAAPLLAACLAGRAGGFGSNLEYRHRDEDNGEAGFYGYLTGLARFTILF